MGRATQMERIIAKGQLVPLRFAKINAAGTVSATAMNVTETNDGTTTSLITVTEYVMPWDFEVVGISVVSNEARTAGTYTVDATIDGTATGLQAVLDATNTTRDTGSQPRGTDVGVAGSRVGCVYTTASWTPTSADVEAVVWVLLHLEGI